MYLVDTNVWLERLLDQARSEEVGQFLNHVSSNQLLITDFAFHSICIVLTRLGQKEVLLDFVRDVFVDGAVTLVSIQPEEIQSLTSMMDRFNLDFDDAYQHVAEKRKVVIVSFDGDFDRTEQGKKTPAEVLAAG